MGLDPERDAAEAGIQGFAKKFNEAMRSAWKGDVPMQEKPARPPVGPSPLGAQDASGVRAQLGGFILDQIQEKRAAEERRAAAAQDPREWRVGGSPGTNGHTIYVGTELAAMALNPDMAQHIVDTMNAAREAS